MHFLLFNIVILFINISATAIVCVVAHLNDCPTGLDNMYQDASELPVFSFLKINWPFLTCTKMHQNCQFSVFSRSIGLFSYFNQMFVFLRKHKKNLRKVKIYLLTSCNTEERIAQNIYIHNSNKIIKN